MFSTKVIFLAMLVGVNCRFIVVEDPTGEIEEALNIESNDGEDLYFEVPFESVYPRNSRLKREIQTSLDVNSDGSMTNSIQVPIAKISKNILSGVGSVGYDFKNDKIGSFGGGLALENVNGHGVSLTGRHITGFGDQLTGAGHVNLIHNSNHRVDANAFATRTMLNTPTLKNFNTFGGGVDYMFKNKIGGSLSVAHTPIFQKTDYSAMGKLNLFRNRGSSLDFNGGFSKSMSPFMSGRSWTPSVGLSFSKSW